MSELILWASCTPAFGPEQLIALTPEEAETALAWRRVLTAATWGELRRTVDPRVVEVIEEYADDDSERFPDTDDSTDFSITDFSAYQDGDWPPDPRSQMLKLLPPQVIAAVGGVEETVLNGNRIVVPREKGATFVEALENAGYDVQEDSRLRGLLVDIA